jgi:hypothetical protein
MNGICFVPRQKEIRKTEKLDPIDNRQFSFIYFLKTQKTSGIQPLSAPRTLFFKSSNEGGGGEVDTSWNLKVSCNYIHQPSSQ